MNTQDNLLRVLDDSRSYWLQKLAGDLTLSSFPYDFIKVKKDSVKYAGYRFDFNPKISLNLFKMSGADHRRLYIIIHSVIAIMLGRYSNNEEPIIGSPILKQKTEGNFINTLLPIRSRINGDQSFKEMVLEIQAILREAYWYQNYPLAKLEAELQPGSAGDALGLFGVLIALENIHDTRYCRKVACDFKIFFRFSNSVLSAEVQYDVSLYNESTIERILKNMEIVFAEVIKDTSLAVKEINMLSPVEKEQLLIEFNSTVVKYDGGQVIHELFEEQVGQTPEKIAVVCEEEVLTYRELNAKANQLARLLRSRGVKPNTIVGIITERSLELIIGILGVLKAGGAYLPLDPQSPEERIRFMLEDSRTGILLTKESLAGKCNFGQEVIDLDDEAIYCSEATKLESLNQPSDLAYVIYTSGTTGKPKGVMIEHRNVIAYRNAFQGEFQIDEAAVVLQQATCAFDIFVEEVYPVLLSGGKLVIYKSEAVFDLLTLAELVKQHAVNIISCSPLMLNELNNPNYLKYLDSVRLFISGGDVLKPEYFANIIKNSKVYNTYGPTETTVCATYFNCNKEYAGLDNVPIGKPISNYHIYILNQDNNLLPVGVPGEICISGGGLGRGYLNQPQLTTAKFVSNPFVANTKMYRTGDLARWLPDGNIEFLGRVDHQVKIRGFRIEIGEIENCLTKHVAVQEAIVVAKEDNNGVKYLFAYIVAKQELSVAEIRQYLSRTLPDYMIPACFLQLPKLPLTPNGKIDRKSLPEPDRDRQTGARYVAPANETEAKLAQLWREVLGIETVGVDDNFFELGGHSLKAITVVSRIAKDLDVDLPLREIFATPTIRQLAKYIQHAVGGFYNAIGPVPPQEYYPVSSAQKRLYIISQLEGADISYNMPGVMTIEGQLDREKFEAAFHGLVGRHETLRTSFEMVSGEPVQRVHEQVDFAVRYWEATVDETETIIQSFVKPFDLSQAPLLRVGLIKLSEIKHIMLFDMHHIISDGVSLAILVREFISLYQGAILPELRIQYKDFSAWQNEFFKSAAIAKQEEYWRQIFNGSDPYGY